MAPGMNADNWLRSFVRCIFVALLPSLLATPIQAAAPRASITQPLANSVFPLGGSVLIVANATASGNASIKRVDFYANNSLIGNATAAPYSMSWKPSNAGSYTLTARATDSKNQSTTSAPVPITFNALPTVSLTSPAPNASFVPGANVVLTANASDAGGSVVKVEFYWGTTLIGAATAAPYSVTWANVASGNYTLVAKATDNNGATATSTPVPITVNEPASVSLTSPAPNALFVPPATVIISATASDIDGTVTKVDFYADGTLLGTTAVTPYSYTWNSVPVGWHQLVAKATDDRGAETSSTPVMIYRNAAPSVTLTAPVNNSIHYVPAEVSLAADASDSDGAITKVEFYAGDTLLGTASDSPYRFTWGNARTGSYQVIAAATDDMGTVTQSSPITVNVSLFNPLNISVSSPEPNATVNDDVALVTGSFQQAESNIGITANGVVAAQYGNNFYAVVPIQLGSNEINVSATTIAGIRSGQAINLTGTGPAPIQVRPDTMAGTAPMTVKFAIKNNTASAISHIDADFNGDGVVDFSSDDPTAILSCTYAIAGVYEAKFRISDSQGVVTEKNVLVVVNGEAKVNNLLNAHWSGFGNALASGNKEQALAFLSSTAQVKYGPVFDVLMPRFAQILPTWSPLFPSKISEQFAEYVVVTNSGANRRVFFVQFVLDADGVWRLEGM